MSPKRKRPRGEEVERQAWTNMKNRCLNPKNSRYAQYGGRGITICERWMVYENFLADMGRRPSPTHSLDRIDNDKGYSPENCRWATLIEQQHNRRPWSQSGLKGAVFWKGRYTAQIQTGGKMRYLGRYDTAEEASAAYWAAYNADREKVSPTPLTAETK